MFNLATSICEIPFKLIGWCLTAVEQLSSYNLVPYEQLQHIGRAPSVRLPISLAVACEIMWSCDMGGTNMMLLAGHVPSQAWPYRSTYVFLLTNGLGWNVLIILQLISWEVDLMGVDLVGSRSIGSWFSGSWFRESWSHGLNSQNNSFMQLFAPIKSIKNFLDLQMIKTVLLFKIEMRCEEWQDLWWFRYPL